MRLQQGAEEYKEFKQAERKTFLKGEAIHSFKNDLFWAPSKYAISSSDTENKMKSLLS